MSVTRVRVNLSLSEDDYNVLCEYANKLRLTPSTYARSLVINGLNSLSSDNLCGTVPVRCDDGSVMRVWSGYAND